MTVYFFDSSVLVKRYIGENGTPWVRSVVAPGSGHRVIIAQVTPVEMMSAVSRLMRDQVIPARSALAIRAFVNRHAEREYIVVNLSKVIVQQAQNLLHHYPLRGYDAIQLTSALDSNTKIVIANQPPLVFVCADKRLLNAAVNEGLQTQNPT